jgi:hypothetical protein
VKKAQKKPAAPSGIPGAEVVLPQPKREKSKQAKAAVADRGGSATERVSGHITLSEGIERTQISLGVQNVKQALRSIISRSGSR